MRRIDRTSRRVRGTSGDIGGPCKAVTREQDRRAAFARLRNAIVKVGHGPRRKRRAVPTDDERVRDHRSRRLLRGCKRSLHSPGSPRASPVASCSIISTDDPSTEEEKGSTSARTRRSNFVLVIIIRRYHCNVDSTSFDRISRARGKSEENDLEELTAVVIHVGVGTMSYATRMQSSGSLYSFTSRPVRSVMN